MSLREKGGALSLIPLHFLFLFLLDFCSAATAVRVSEQTIPVTINGHTRTVVVPFWVLPSGVTAAPPASSLAPVVVSILSEALLTFPSALSTSLFIPPVPVAGSTYNIPSHAPAEITTAVTGGVPLPTGNAISVLESALSTYMVPGATAITVVLPVPVTDPSATRLTTEVIHLPPATHTSESSKPSGTSSKTVGSEVPTGSSRTSVRETARTSTTSRQPLSSSSHRSTSLKTATSKATTKPSSSKPTTFSTSLSMKTSRVSSENHQTSSHATGESSSSETATTTATTTTSTRTREQTSVPPAPNANGGAASGTVSPVFLAAALCAGFGALLIQ